jgi:hypothetical protein
MLKCRLSLTGGVMVRKTVLALSLAVASTVAAQPFSWQEPQARVIETGDLEWTPKPFVFEPTETLRYIDYETGNDANPGTREQPWKHHPLDPASAGASKAFTDAATFVFKRGVTYRGHIKGAMPAGDVRLTSDPTWGQGEAVLLASDRVTGFARQGDPRMPARDNVWSVELDFAPRTLWMVDGSGEITRLTLARHPNWTWSDPDDIRAGWFEWEQPEWWTQSFKIPFNNGRAWRGTDTKNLTEPADFYQDAIVWSEWGIVMGSPFASKVEGVEKGALIFQGPWYGDGEMLMTGCRYYLEDKPHYLDEAGEFWFDKTPDSDSGRLYVRLPGDVDPNSVVIEAGRWINHIDVTDFDRLSVSGLTFRFGNVFYDLTAREFVDRDVEGSAVRVLGSGNELNIRNNLIEHAVGGVIVRAPEDDDRIGTIRIHDNVIRRVDRHAVSVADSTRWAKSDPPFSTVERVEVMRNNISLTGYRPHRAGHGHCVWITFADLVEIAGNFVDRVGGAGLVVSGGKGSGELRDKPLARSLIYQNRVSEALQWTNDWGNFATWQGGPHYLFNNVSINPNGYWHWSFKSVAGQPDRADWGSARQGFAYYHDGSFKNHVFNNIAWGANNTMGDKRANATAFQEIISFQNQFANNTAYRFAVGSRRQAPQAGRNHWLGNVFEDISVWLWLNAEPRGAAADGNAGHVGERVQAYQYESMAFGSNVIHAKPRAFAVFEADGQRYADLASFSAGLVRRHALRSDVGIDSPTPVLASPESRDMTLRADSPAIDRGVKVFAPWGLYATVGEWHFTENQKDASVALDDHWYMAPYYASRDHYWRTPRHDLQGVGIGEADYVEGALEDWTRGAVRLDGRSQSFKRSHADLVKPYTYDSGNGQRTVSGLEIANPNIGESNLLIEAYLRTSDPAGTIAAKMGPEAGYSLELQNGRPALRIRMGGMDLMTVVGNVSVSDGAWHHVIAELDRAKGVTLYVDGTAAAAVVVDSPITGTLANESDFVVGEELACEIDFLRVARGTLADARTTIAELHAWQFDGPFLRDFTGAEPRGRRDAGAIERR